MRKLKYSFVVILLIFLLPDVRGQKIIKNSSITGVCYAGNKVTKIFIPPPDSFYKKSGSKGDASITIYYTGFTAQAKIAMEHARLILQRMLPADTKMTIVASYEAISTAGVLANTSITGYAAGWGIDALNPLAYYPVALAEKIYGESLNPDLQGDMELRVNSSSSVSWYFGIDGNTPTNQYDLVTVVIHEICHGLGFFDSMNTDGKAGYYGVGSLQIPMIYDTFIESLAGNKLTDTLKFLNPSSSLHSQLTGGQLWFNGPLLSKYNAGARAKLYAPSTFDPGSSISHLEESVSVTAEINSLMTPFIDRGEAIHDPGKLTYSILGDLGWINTRIIHTPSEDTEAFISELPVSVEIKSDTLFNRDKVGVVYSFNNFETFETLYLISIASNNTFSGKISIPAYNTDVQYYFFVEDYFKRIYRSPSLFELFRYNVYVGSDTVKPVISHTPAEYYLETVNTLSLKALVTDNIGIDTVYVEYKINDGPSMFAGMKHDADTFSLSLNARLFNLNGGDSLKYRFFAKDIAASPNTSVLPKNGYFSVSVEEISDVVDSYSTNFSNASTDFFNNGFTIGKPVNFTKFGLHSIHPYKSTESNDQNFEYFALLRHPLKFNESGLLIRFNEVVLVEPGETGSVYGSDDFYDYVVIEGSKDFGKTWFDLIDGYDSRYSGLWLASYNSNIVGQNSESAGTESMLQNHTIYYKPSDNISAGDTLLLRFKLFSDPFANGWGWGIEELRINPLIDNVENTQIDRLAVFPNPGNGRINLIDYKSAYNSGGTIKVSVYNSAGICIVNKQLNDKSGMLVDISPYETGIYIIVLYMDDGIKTFKYSLIK